MIKILNWNACKGAVIVKARAVVKLQGGNTVLTFTLKRHTSFPQMSIH